MMQANKQSNIMSNKTSWCCLILYLAIFGSYCGLEIDTVVEDLPLLQWSTCLLFFNVLFVLMLPPLVYALLYSIKPLWNRRAVRNAVLIVNSIYFIFALLFSLYKSARNMDFDFYFFWYNLSVALSVLWKLYAPWLFVIALCVAGFVFFQKIAFAPIVVDPQQVAKKSLGYFCRGRGTQPAMPADHNPHGPRLNGRISVCKLFQRSSSQE